MVAGRARRRPTLTPFGSWYDPHVRVTFDSFKQAVREASEGRLDADLVTQASILLASSSQLSPAGQAGVRQDWLDRLRGIGPEVREAYKDRALSVAAADVSEAIAHHLQAPRYASLGAAALIDRSNTESPGFFARVLPA